jgi:colicin import membrane protein
MLARLLSLLAVAAAVPAWAADPNLITGVEVKDVGAEVVLSVKCSKRPSFTTFSMADPPRFVIDFSESKFQGVPAELPGSGGVVQSVKNLSYGSDASAIARVMVAFTAEVDPPAVEEAGEALLIRIAKPGSTAVAAAEPAADSKAEAEAQARADAAAAKAKAEADARAQAEALAASKAKAEADAKAQADAAAAAKAKAEADAKEQAEALATSRARAEADAKAQADAAAASKAKAEADAKAQAEAAAKVRAEADARAQADAAAAKARAEADARVQADAVAAAKAKADADAKAQADAAAAVAKAKVASAAPPAATSDAEQSELEAEIAAAKAEAAPRATGNSTGKAAAQVERLAPAGTPSLVREVGFRQLPDASRIYVRTSAAPQFTVQEVDERTVRIEVENARATRRNDLRFMDTSFFPSAVQLITPSRQGSSYVLTVKLRQRVPYQQKVEGDMLAIDFQRPASGGAEAQPSKAPAAEEESAPGAEQAE